MPIEETTLANDLEDDTVGEHRRTAPPETKRSQVIGDRRLDESGVEFVKVHPEAADRESPFTSKAASDLANDAHMVHERTRTEAAQRTDESFNAPLASTYNQWLRNPNRYDLAGVDTIPRERQRARATAALERAQAAGFVGEVEVGDPERTMRNTGQFKARKPATVPALDEPFETKVSVADEDVLERVRERKGDFDKHSLGFILAHEVGHAVDFGAAKGGLVSEGHASEDILSLEADVDVPEGTSAREFRRTLNQEALDVSRRLRGKLGGNFQEYQESVTELTADAFASFTLEPRAFRREAPNLAPIIEARLGGALERGSAD